METILLMQYCWHVLLACTFFIVMVMSWIEMETWCGDNFTCTCIHSDFFTINLYSFYPGSKISDQPIIFFLINIGIFFFVVFSIFLLQRNLLDVRSVSCSVKFIWHFTRYIMKWHSYCLASVYIALFYGLNCQNHVVAFLQKVVLQPTLQTCMEGLLLTMVTEMMKKKINE